MAPAEMSSTVADGKALLIRISVPVPVFTMLVTLVPVNALRLLMINELVGATPKVALPVKETGPTIMETPLSLVIVPPLRTFRTLFNGTRFRLNRSSAALLLMLRFLVESPNWPVLFCSEKIPCTTSMSPRAASMFVMLTNET